jgi:hypothetical protein
VKIQKICRRLMMIIKKEIVNFGIKKNNIDEEEMDRYEV